MNDKLENNINNSFSEMDKTINKLKKNIEHTDFKDKVKISFPIALMSSVLTLLGYLLIQYFI